jgi:hypothetical protein
VTLIWEALKRTAALIGSEIAVLMASASIMDIEAWKAAVMTAIAAALTVWASISKSYYTDGKLTKAEVDEAFKK